MNLTRYQRPESWMQSSLDAIAGLQWELDQLFGGDPRTFGFVNRRTPALDLREDKDNVYARVELPGMKREEIEVSIHNNQLTIFGERKATNQAKEGNSTTERFVGRFQRTVNLPSRIDPTKVSATYKAGVLTVSLSKPEESKARQIKIEAH